MNNENYNLLKVLFPNLPKDSRTFDKKILDDPLLFIKSLYESIKEYSNNEELKQLMDNIQIQNINNYFIQFLKTFGIDRTDLLNSNLSNIEIYGKLLQDMQSIIPKTNMNNLMFAPITLYKIYYVLFDVRAIDNSLRNVIVGLFYQYISFSLGLVINDEVKVISDFLLEHNEFSESDYKIFNEFYAKSKKYNEVLNKYSYDNTNMIRLLPHVLWAVIELSRSMVSSSREKILTAYNINEISEENKKLLGTYFSGFLDLYYVNKDAKKNKKIILSSYFINILEETNETLGDKKLNQGELQLLWYYIKSDNGKMSEIRDARRKSLDIFLDKCRSLYKEDNTAFESAKSRYNILKRDEEVLNKDEYSAFIVLYVFFNNKNYRFLKECRDEYNYLLIKYPLFEFIKYIHKMHSELKQNKLEKYLYDFISS